jgi:hypothetical protein
MTENLVRVATKEREPYHRRIPDNQSRIPLQMESAKRAGFHKGLGTYHVHFNEANSKVD